MQPSLACAQPTPSSYCHLISLNSSLSSELAPFCLSQSSELGIVVQAPNADMATKAEIEAMKVAVGVERQRKDCMVRLCAVHAFKWGDGCGGCFAARRTSEQSAEIWDYQRQERKQN